MIRAERRGGSSRTPTPAKLTQQIRRNLSCLGKPTDFSIEPPTDRTMEQLRGLVASFGLTVQISG